MEDLSRVQSLVKQLYGIVDELEGIFPGRHFTPDGHMVGSLGECLVAQVYGLKLMTASNKGFDALSQCGKQVEIKATQSKSVAFRSGAEHVIAIKILRDGTFEEIYNGPGAKIWEQFSGKKLPTNGQYQISLTKLKAIQENIPGNDQIKRV